MAMLDKDPSRRPSIWELSQTPCIHECINNFVHEKECQDEVATIFEYRSDCDYTADTEKISSGENYFDTSRLDVITHFIRSDISLADCKNGWFSTVSN